ncbi:MAG TPA: choice-of-anchor G family protein [Galbitalea sp.]|nr:choice-of-anchor G family protein [Galbitalea sp.]
MFARIVSRVVAARRRTKAIAAAVTVAALAIAGLGIAPSLAGWTRTLYDNGPASTLNCSAGATVNTQASGQLISGEVAGNLLTSDLATVAPLNVSNIAPATASSTTGATPATAIGGSAWTSALNVQALNSINITPTVQLPLNSSLTVGTQYGRATSGGIATGASGAVSGAGDGTVKFQPTGSATSFGTLSLQTALSSAIGATLASDVSQLSNASLTIGALGSITDEQNGCQNLWQGIQNTAASVARSYVLADLDLNLTSSLVGQTTTAISAAVTGLGTTLNALEPSGSILNTAAVDPTTHTSLTGALTSLLNVATILPGVGIGVTGAPTVTVGVTFNLASIASLLTGPISANGVTINLGTGAITVDLAQLLGKSDLSGYGPNTSLLSPDIVSSIVSGVTGDIATLINTTVNNAIKQLVTSAAVAVSISTDIGVNALGLNLDALGAKVNISGTLGDFVDEAHNSPPTVSVVVKVLGSAGLLTTIANGLITPVTNLLTAGVLPAVLQLVDDLALNTVSTNALADLSTTLTTLDSGAISTLDTAFGAVLGVVQSAVSLTVNAQPDQTGGVGTPDGSVVVPGRYFDSALVLGVLNNGGTPVLGLYLGSSSAGPVSLR